MEHQDEHINFLLQRIKALEKENAKLFKAIQDLIKIRNV